MPLDPADNTRAKRRRRLTRAELRARQTDDAKLAGRVWRARSWLTILVAILAVVLCFVFLRRTG
jgi:hypothetical protein